MTNTLTASVRTDERDRREVTVRLAQPTEYRDLGELVVRSFSSVMEVSAEYAADMRDIAGHALTADVWVAVSDGSRGNRPLGVVLTPKTAEVPLDEHGGDWPGERGFRLLAVAPEARGLGVGHALIDHAVRRIGALGFRRVGIGTGLRMRAARRLYESYGFVRRPERETVIVDGGYRAVQYAYDIPAPLVHADPVIDAQEALREAPHPVDAPGSIPYFLKALTRELPGEIVDTSAETLETVSHDRSRFIDEERAVASITPTTVEQVQTAVRLAAKYGFPVFVRGAGTGLAGGAVPTRTGVVIDTSGLTAIGEPDLTSHTIRVQAGAITADVNRRLEGTGLFYAPDPASSGISTIGGNIATNAGGFHCVKYGVTRDSLLSLRVVLADGSVIETGSRAIKNVAGLDLTSLFTGSEGTLGVVVEATLRLRPRPVLVATALGFYGTLAEAAQAVQRVSRADVQPSIFELLAIPAGLYEDERYREAAAGRRWLLIVQTDGYGAVEAARVVTAALQSKQASVLTPDEDAVAALFALRSGGKPVPDGSWMVGGDAAVPIGELPEYLHELERIASESGYGYSLVAHVGDGNVHSAFFVGRNGESEPPEGLVRAHARLVRKAIALGGTSTGEHGIGIELRGFLAEQVGDRNLAVQRAIKAALDPRNILNPGKWL
ncbi:GNAT family N-acetyltransferase [Bifidobacterium margollesii]|uniref:GNAT family N-acetyltransferase n=1 Tax=Bifidobacterium margollesii TaxID=2020964 RepID=A0A2N5JBW2_9BIFI|nr:GNAT family N-acetyltransferase [Bifidobacterium margollesii]PLS31694.1 GNAT family N-acetyltransferase [Bifidobacterium margollesii]